MGVVRRSAIIIVVSSAALVYLIWLPDTLNHTRHLFVADSASADRASKLRAAAWLDTHTVSADTVVVDDQVIAVLAHRLVPPKLTDTSSVRCVSGYLPPAMLRAATQASQVKAILLTRAIPANPECASYVSWLKQHYTVVRLPAGLGASVAYLRQ
jgi:hypothetical protein